MKNLMSILFITVSLVSPLSHAQFLSNLFGSSKKQIKLVTGKEIGAKNCNVSLKLENLSDDTEKATDPILLEIITKRLNEKGYQLAETDKNGVFQLNLKIDQIIHEKITNKGKVKREAECKVAHAQLTIPSVQILLQDATTSSSETVGDKDVINEELATACSNSLKKALSNIVSCVTLRGYQY